MILQLSNRKSDFVAWLLMGVFLVCFLLYQPAYLNTHDLYFWFGLVALPFSFKISRTERSTRFFWPGLCFALFSVSFPTTFGLFCVLVFSSLFIIEQLQGKTTFLFAIHLLLLSPLFQYFNSLISFPIRLGLSGAAGSLLQLAGFDIQLSGNLIKLDGVDFLVDSACSGLFMLRYSFLFAVIILAFFQREGKTWHLKEVASLFAALFLFNILGNLVRIILLIVFKVMPGFWFHDALGLLIFLLYCLLPFYLLTRFWSGKKKLVESAGSKNTRTSLRTFSISLLVLLFTFGISGWRNSHRVVKPVRLNEGVSLYYQAKKVNESVYKLQTEKALIYLKPPVEAYHADHNPLICWKGSGYDFKHIHTSTINGLEVSVAELIKDKGKLYTMWWFDSGKSQTGSQWDWRWKSLSQNEKFYLVNITAESMEALHIEAEALLAKKIIE